MKKLTLLLIGLLMAGCSRNSFDSDMKGIGFWEPQQVIHDAINQHSFDALGKCFSTFIILGVESDWNDFQMNRRLGMGIPQNMAHRVTDGHKSLVRAEDITKVEWNSVDSSHAQGAFEFDAFYGSGRIIFQATQMKDEWVLNYMAVPRKNTSDEDNPFVVFEYSGEELEKMFQQGP